MNKTKAKFSRRSILEPSDYRIPINPMKPTGTNDYSNFRNNWQYSNEKSNSSDDDFPKLYNKPGQAFHPTSVDLKIIYAYKA